MNVSSISQSVAPPIPVSTAKAPAGPAQQASKPVAPPAVTSVADSDGDHDGSSGRIDVKA
jgi:hypothetical protein